ncbi:hypothetical protein Taro_041789 [Colocasia esculenta]|uniref:Uncharacterized protein n=1 Tax=Colocasia esculenta TaxID=4460 RepID=A0A843WUL7_COLES|nr:hypothetical protein [Colocasia esculenta]
MARTLEHHQTIHKTHRSANNRLTADQSIIIQTRPSWHRRQDTATKVSPSVTERSKVLRARQP